MPNFDDGFVPEDTPEDEAQDFEPDTATIAFLDQQQAEFVNMEEEFEATYGFKHECHCGEDYAAGRVGEITQCYHNMMQEALATCARLQAELKEMTGIAQALFRELQSRIEAEGGAEEVQPEPTDAPEFGLRLVEGDSTDSGEPVDDGADTSADDAAGEGLGASHPTIGDEGTPDDRKLI